MHSSRQPPHQHQQPRQMIVSAAETIRYNTSNKRVKEKKYAIRHKLMHAVSYCYLYLQFHSMLIHIINQAVTAAIAAAEQEAELE